tara:strand:- start:49 stop:1128 length:1080 start_codon:yes stop_codon:yes gene_type:complete
MSNHVKRILITGGAGFIGSNCLRYLLKNDSYQLLNIDLLTYAGNYSTIENFENNERYSFSKGDIADSDFLEIQINEFMPDYIINFAAESHVDRSISSPYPFIRSNILGTYHLLEQSLSYLQGKGREKLDHFRFLHVSTDEVFGSLEKDQFFTELSRYDPSSPYSASKASSDHLVRSWNRTFNLPTLITNCSNNFGPYQFPEKLIPLAILHALNNRPIPIYGKGDQVRDWLYVDDHVDAIETVLIKGEVGQTYNIGANNPCTNISIVEYICKILDKLKPRVDGSSYNTLINFVDDRPGHDNRYAIDSSKIERELGWTSKYSFEESMQKTIQWYMDNLEWCDEVSSETYDMSRLGLIKKGL